MKITKKQTEHEINEALKWLGETDDEPKARKDAILYAFKQTGRIVTKENIRELTSKEVEEWTRVYREGLRLHKD